MNSSEKRLIECLINRNDVKRYDAAVNFLFYGESHITHTIQDVVRKSFSAHKYDSVRNCIYDVFANQFYEYFVLQAKPDTLRKIDDLGKYIFRAAVNCANSKRKQIDTALGLPVATHEVGFTPRYDREDDEDNSEAYQENSVLTEQGHDNIQSQEIESAHVDETGTSVDMAAFILEGYIKRIDKKEFREVLYALDIEGLSSKEYAARTGETSTSIDMRHSRALTELTRVALPDILKRCKGVFVRFQGLLSSLQVSILQEFFETGNLGDKEKQKRIATAYKALAKAAKKEYEMEEKEYKRDKRERELQEKAVVKP